MPPLWRKWLCVSQKMLCIILEAGNIFDIRMP